MSGMRIVASVFASGDAFGDPAPRLVNERRRLVERPDLEWQLPRRCQEAFTSVGGTPKLAEEWFADLFQPDDRIVFHKEEIARKRRIEPGGTPGPTRFARSRRRRPSAEGPTPRGERQRGATAR